MKNIRCRDTFRVASGRAYTVTDICIGHDEVRLVGAIGEGGRTGDFYFFDSSAVGNLGQFLFICKINGGTEIETEFRAKDRHLLVGDQATMLREELSAARQTLQEVIEKHRREFQTK